MRAHWGATLVLGTLFVAGAGCGGGSLRDLTNDNTPPRPLPSCETRCIGGCGESVCACTFACDCHCVNACDASACFPGMCNPPETCLCDTGSDGRCACRCAVNP